MTIIKIQKCGIITIPKIMREALNIKPGDIVTFKAGGDGTIYMEFGGGKMGKHRQIKKKKPDIVHWSHEFGLFCLTPKTTAEYINLLEKINQLGIKQTVTYHSVPVNGNNFFREYYEMSSPFFEKIVAHTKEQMDKLIEY